MLVFELKFHSFQKKIAHIVEIPCYNIVIIGINIFQFYVSITSN
jgi:hypothetical protein